MSNPKISRGASGVRTWPTYLLTGIPAATRALLSAEASERDVSVADVIRQALCAHYQMDCPDQSTRYEPERDEGHTTFVLRLQPELWNLIKQDTGSRYGEIKTLVADVLDKHLGGTT